MTLSKSDYMLFLRHPAWLWLKKFEKHKLPPIDDNLKALFEAGHLFESYAEKNFPQATKLGFNNYQQYLSLPHKTLEALNNGAESILQGRFETDGLTCIVDVLEKISEQKVNLIEIKASTHAKPTHYYDLAFQSIVLQKSGFKVETIEVIHANKKYVRDGAIDHTQITAKTEVTDKVKELIPLTIEQIDKAKEVLSSQTMPDLSPGLVNQVGVPGVSKWMQEWLSTFLNLQPQTDDYNIYALSYPSPEQIAKLEEQGITNIKEMTEDQALR
ncbi:MAG: hypothetical protein U9O78_03560, partial [Patescibacteria group bacterium]|nr:hypothetical protein [Patescibacteria group bacterium]